MKQTFPPPRNPMAPLFRRAAESLTTSLTAESAHFYQCTGHHFLNYLDAQHPRVRSLGQLRRDPHILDWLTLLRSHQPPLAKQTYAHYVNPSAPYSRRAGLDQRNPAPDPLGPL